MYALAGSRTATEARQPTAYAWAPKGSSHRRHRERTAEEKVQDLRRTILDMQREVAGSTFYRRAGGMPHHTGTCILCMHAPRRLLSDASVQTECLHLAGSS